MNRRIGIAANGLGLTSIVMALLTRGNGTRGVYFNETVEEPFWLFDPDHVPAWLIAAIVLVLVGTGLLLRRD